MNPNSNHQTPAENSNTQADTENAMFSIGNPGELLPPTPKVSLAQKYQLAKKIEAVQSWLLKNWWIALSVTLALAILIVVIVAQVILGNKSIVAGPYNNVLIRLEGPDTLPKGNPGTWKVFIENKESTPLENIEINLDFDKSFEFAKAVSPSPDRPQGDKYKISRLDSYQNGIYQAVVEFQGVTKGNIDEEIEMKGQVSYSPQALSRLKNSGKLAAGETDRRALPLTTLKTRTTSARININMSPTEELVPNNNEAEMTIKFENTSEKEIKDLRIQMIYPQGFTYSTSELRADSFSSSKNTPDDSNNIWLLNTFNRLSSQTLRFKGPVTGANGVKLPFTINMQLRNGENWQTISTRTRDITITGKPLALNTKIISKDNGGVIKPGESLDLVIDYENQGSIPLSNVEITGTIQDPASILDWTSVKFSGGDSGNLENRNLIWSGKNVPQLATLGVNVKGQLRYSIGVKSDQDFLKQNLKQNDYILIPNAQAKAQSLQTVNVSGSTYKSKGDIFFSQAISDITSQATKAISANKKIYKVTWSISTTQNQINQVEIKARSGLLKTSFDDLFSSIRPESKQPELSYISNTGEITWKANSVPAYSGLSNPLMTISFNIVTENNDTELFASPEVVGVDDFTGARYTKSGDVGRVR